MDKLEKLRGIRGKMFIAFILVSIVPLSFFALGVSSSIRDYYFESRQGELKFKANQIALSIDSGNYLVDNSKEALLVSEINDKFLGENNRILIIDNRGIVAYDSNSALKDITFVSPEVISAFNKRSGSTLQKDKISMYTTVPIYNNEGAVIGVVLLVSSVEDIYALLDSIQNTLWLLTIATILIILVVVFFMSDLLISPLKKILRVVTLMSEGHLNQRIDIKSHDEYRKLATAFNNMNDKLEQVEKTREEFVSNVSHELKTPLSSIKVLSESILLQSEVPPEMYREFLQDINSEIDRMTLIVNDLLNLVKLDQRDMPLNIKQTDLNRTIEDILKRLYPLAEVKGIELLYENVRKVSILADEMKLSLAISNLVENGIKYTPDNGTVKVTIDSDHQNAFITVQDTGLGIAEEELGKIFNRFYRVDKTRDRGTGGTGLGLSITHSTVLLHNGSIRVSSKEGEGTTFVVRLPLHQNV